jgi:hypothetical protein
MGLVDHASVIVAFVPMNPFASLAPLGFISRVALVIPVSYPIVAHAIVLQSVPIAFRVTSSLIIAAKYVLKIAVYVLIHTSVMAVVLASVCKTRPV